MEITLSQSFNQFTNKASVSNKISASSSLSAKSSDNNTLHKKENFGSAITIATFATVLSIFMLSRGFQKGTGKVLTKLKGYLEGKRDLSSISDSSKKTRFYAYSARKLNSFIKKLESVNNINSLKDILFMKLMYKTKTTENIHKAITNYFEKVSRKTVINSYKKTDKYFKEMNESLDKLDNFILKDSPDEKIIYKNKEYTKRELVNLARTNRDIASMFAQSFMSKSALDIRYDHINKATKDLPLMFWDASFKDFWTKNNKFKRKEMWQTFIAEAQLKGDKKNLTAIFDEAREVLSYTSSDKTKRMQNYIRRIDNIIPPNDREGINIIEKLEWLIKNPDEFAQKSEIFVKELQKLKNHRIPISDINIAKTNEEFIKNNVETLITLANETATGEIQDMLAIYYRIAPYELDKSGALLAVKKAVHSFKKSVNLESEEFFDKVRDLRLGSAPTDVLTILLSFIALSFGLGYAQDKDKRISVMLKSGIPIVGAIATTTFTAMRLVSGGKSLALGFLSGIVLNQIGKIADYVRKNAKPSNINDNSEKRA